MYSISTAPKYYGARHKLELNTEMDLHVKNLDNKLCLELAAVNEVWSIDTVVYLDKNEAAALIVKLVVELSSIHCTVLYCTESSVCKMCLHVCDYY